MREFPQFPHILLCNPDSKENEISNKKIDNDGCNQDTDDVSGDNA